MRYIFVLSFGGFGAHHFRVPCEFAENWVGQPTWVPWVPEEPEGYIPKRVRGILQISWKVCLWSGAKASRDLTKLQQFNMFTWHPAKCVDQEGLGD